MDHVTHDITDAGKGRGVWEAYGRPPVPAVVAGEQVVPVLHVSQVASLLGLPLPDTRSGVTLAWDAVTVLDSWLSQVERLDWQQLTLPTRSRGRTLRNLTVNVFRPYGLLPAAWRTGEFPWGAGGDEPVEAALTTERELLDWAFGVLADWQGFLLDHADELGDRDPEVVTPKGTVAYSVVLTSQRYHAAAHHRQLVHTLAEWGLDVDDVLDVERLEGLELAERIF